MPAFVFIVFLALGIGRNLPFQEYFVFGLGFADVLFITLALLLLIDPRTRQSLFREVGVLIVPIAAISVMAALAMLSVAVNAAVFGMQGKDFFEILRNFYLLTVMIVACLCTRMLGGVAVLAFALGVIVSGVVAFLNPMNPDVFGTPQIFNPNVIGNALSAAIVLCALAILTGRTLSGSLLAVAAILLAFFTFSKGAWLMSIMALGACYLALGSLRGSGDVFALKVGRWVSYVVFGTLALVVYQYWGLISLVVEAKIAATDFGASATEGGSFSARVGLIQSALRMATMNPLLGVGISNFERVNRFLQPDLGAAYYDDDNPNSAWFYVLACMGVPAFLMFTAVFVWFLYRTLQIPRLGRRRWLFAACVGGVFLVGGNVQSEMLTGYYYWVALGSVAAWSTSRWGQLSSFSVGTTTPAS